jgi:Pectate lyase superfamily protein
MPLTELFAYDRAQTTVTSGGTDAPVSGTVETWTVASSAMFGTAVAGVSQFHVSDPFAPSEVIAVTAVSGTAWTVTRGSGNTTPVPHAAGFLVFQTTTAGFLGGVAPSASPAFTGVPTAPTASPLTGTTQVATTAYSDAAGALKAPLASPALTGTPTAPTASPLTSSTQIATTAYTDTAAALKAPLASAALTGTPTAPTASALTNSTRIATTAYTDSAVSVSAGLLLPKSGNLSALASFATSRANLGTQRRHNAAVDYGASPAASGAVNLTAIQSAITAAAADGGIAYLPAGTYDISGSALTVPSNTRLTGDGFSETVIVQLTSNVDVLDMLGTSGSPITNVELRHLKLHGPATGTGAGLNLNYCLDTCVFERVWATANGSHGCQMQNSYVTTFRDCWFTSNGGDGFHAVMSVNVVTWHNCVFNSNAGNGFYLNGAAGSGIFGCDFESNGQYGANLVNGYSFTVEACDFEDNGTSSPGSTWASVYVSSPGDRASGVRICGNNFTGTAGVTANGIELASSVVSAYIESNSFQVFADSDILVDSGATGVVIGTNNVHVLPGVSGLALPAVITDNGTGTVYLGTPAPGVAPSDVNLKAWNFDPSLSPGASAPSYAAYTAGVVYLALVEVRNPLLVTGIAAYWSQPTGGSPANCHLGLISPAGTLIGTTADLTSTASGLITPALAGGPYSIPAGSYYVAQLIGTQGGTQGGCWFPANAAIEAFSVFGGAMGSLAVTPAGYRWAKQLSAQTALTSLTLSGNAAVTATPFWAGLL